VALFFLLLKPLNEENVALASAVQTLESTSSTVDGKTFQYNQQTEAEAALAEAKSRKAGKEAQLASLERRKQLPASQALRIETTQPQLLSTTLPRWLMLPERVVTSMERWAESRGKKLGLDTVETTFAAKAPTTDPASVPKAIVAWNLGQMTVTGDFNRVMRWVKDWNNAPLLVAVNDLKCSIADRDGKVTATATLNVYVFPTGPGAGAAAAAAGAVNVAGPGGGMGGPPGMGAAPGMGGPPGAGAPGMSNGP
jgi:hypothetical protein